MVLASIERGEKANITVLTRPGKMSAIPLYKCFKKCGFVLQTEKAEQPSELGELTNSIQPDSGWGLLPDCGGLTFEDFIDVDNISVHGAHNDAELLASQDEEDKEEQLPAPGTLNEARTSLNTLRPQNRSE